MSSIEKVIKGLHQHVEGPMYDRCGECSYYEFDKDGFMCRDELLHDAIALLKEQETVKSKTISEELKQKMWNALYTEEDKFDKKYAGTKEHDNWFLIYRPWLQDGFDLAIKAIADWEGQ